MANEAAIVVGVGPGLGAALVRKFTGQGLEVLAVSRAATKLDCFAGQASPERIHLYDCDATDADAVTAMFAHAADHFEIADHHQGHVLVAQLLARQALEILGRSREDALDKARQIVAADALAVDPDQLAHDPAGGGVAEDKRTRIIILHGLQFTGRRQLLGLQAVDLKKDLGQGRPGILGRYIGQLRPESVPVARRQGGAGRIGVTLILPDVRGHARGKISAQKGVRNL